VKDWQGIGILTQLGWILAFLVLLPLGLGIWADHTFHTSPAFFFVGAIFGILAGTIGAVRVATRAIDDVEKAHRGAAQDTAHKEDKP
jgi:F0F1-type ATP synthase assembly protein I